MGLDRRDFPRPLKLFTRIKHRADEMSNPFELSSSLDTVRHEPEMQDVLENLWCHCGQLKNDPMFDGQLSLRNSSIHDSYGNDQTSREYAPDDNYEVYEAPPAKRNASKVARTNKNPGLAA